MRNEVLKVEMVWKAGVVAAGYVITQLGSQAILEFLELMAEMGVEGAPFGPLVGIAVGGCILHASRDKI